MKGSVKFFNSTKGFGFIKVQGSKDIFFHKSALEHDYVPEDDDYVSFDVRQTEGGQAAENVIKI